MGWDGPITHRQFLGWQEWLFMEWNRPDRSDHYIMSLQQAVKRILSKDPNKIKLADQKMVFRKGTKKKRVLTPEEQAYADMALWVGRIGGWGKVRIRTPDGKVIPPSSQNRPPEFLRKRFGFPDSNNKAE